MCVKPSFTLACTLALTLLAGASISRRLILRYPRSSSRAIPPRPRAIRMRSAGANVPNFFDSSKINVVNEARGGRSSRTFIMEGLWDRLLADVKPGDYVLIQFGHNDISEINGERVARGSIPGLGEETREIDNHATKQHETVHTFGWYMRKMIAETRAKGATPILFSLTVRCEWKDGHFVERGYGQYGEWTRELGKTENAAFVDLTHLVADRYEQMGEAAVKPLFPKDTTHTNAEGADLNARSVVAGLKALRENAIIRTFSAAGRSIEVAPFNMVALPHLTRPPVTAHEDFMRWLNLPDPADPALPSLFLIGDSTIRNGRGDGIDGLGQWGWGDPLAAYFDPSKINVVNRAVGEPEHARSWRRAIGIACWRCSSRAIS